MTGNTHEPPPSNPDSGVLVWPHIIKSYPWQPFIRADMEERHLNGVRKYGVPLMPFNKRDPLVDAYQEALDLLAYMTQEDLERPNDDEMRIKLQVVRGLVT